MCNRLIGLWLKSTNITYKLEQEKDERTGQEDILLD